MLCDALSDHDGRNRRSKAEAEVAALRRAILQALSASERQHVVALNHMRAVLPKDVVIAGDACQLVYTGAFAFPSLGPKQWFYPAGYCALGNALPNGIGAKLALPDRPVVVVAGDGGFMFTMPELMVAAELGLSLPVVIWENGGLKQIQDDQGARDIQRVGVEGINPDFTLLAQACHCRAVTPTSGADFEGALTAALVADRPTLIILKEGASWLI